jgi:hypothetical protein
VLQKSSKLEPYLHTSTFTKFYRDKNGHVSAGTIPFLIKRELLQLYTKKRYNLK